MAYEVGDNFAKIVEILDTNGASFVSVTQQFKTTSSMGRLTLNVLLSFAQFEREVIGERIRDKIAASKRKGMWMGGVPPLGYRAQDRKLVSARAPPKPLLRPPRIRYRPRTCYVGATGSASVGVGVGANVLFGGFGNSISLQPLSIEGSKGFNVAGGLAEMTQ